jgi:hypothetical protein
VFLQISSISFSNLSSDLKLRGIEIPVVWGWDWLS